MKFEQLLLPLPDIFALAAAPPAKPARPAAFKPNVARFQQSLVAALNLSGLSPSVYAVLLSFADQIVATGHAEVFETAKRLCVNRNAVYQHIIGTPAFFHRLPSAHPPSRHHPPKYQLTQEAVATLRRVQKATMQNYEHHTPAAAAAPPA